TGKGQRLFWATSFVGVSLVFVWLVARATDGFSGPIGKWLEFRPLLYIGKISYGIYLYHRFMPDLVRYVFRAAGWAAPHTLRLFFLASALTVVVASASWHLIERPLNRLKDRSADFGEAPPQTRENLAVS